MTVILLYLLTELEYVLNVILKRKENGNKAVILIKRFPWKRFYRPDDLLMIDIFSFEQKTMLKSLKIISTTITKT